MKTSGINSRASLTLTIAMAMAIAAGPVLADETVREMSGVKKTLIPAGEPQTIRTIESKFEPTAVQTRYRTDPDTGAQRTITEPIIMERHDRLLETIINQPVVLETERRHSVGQSSSTFRSSRYGSAGMMSHRRTSSSGIACRRARSTSSTPRSVAFRGTRSGYGTVSSSSSVRGESVEINREPFMRTTTIPGEPALPSEPPQVIQKIEE